MDDYYNTSYYSCPLSLSPSLSLSLSLSPPPSLPPSLYAVKSCPTGLCAHIETSDGQIADHCLADG